MKQKYCQDCGGKDWCMRAKLLTKETVIDRCPFKSSDEGRVRKKIRDWEKDNS